MAPLHILRHLSTVNPDHYIVTLRSDVSITAFIAEHELNVLHVFDGADGAVYGFGAKLSEPQLQAVRNDPAVQEMEEDGLGTCTALGTEFVKTPAPPWSLARLFSDTPVTPGFTEFTRDQRGGEGVDIYIVDSGVRRTHTCFGDRVKTGLNVTQAMGRTDTDILGHGTSCAATAAGEKYGVANHAHIIPVKVLDSDKHGDKPTYGSSMTALGGLYWIRRNVKNTRRPSVVSMSLTYGYSQKLNAAVDGLVRDGVPVVVPAGNHGGPVGTNSPQSATSAIVVGGTDRFDRMYNMSGYGPRVDIFAPAVDIMTADSVNDNSSVNTAGTSLAVPAVAGIIALILGPLKNAGGFKAREILFRWAAKDLIQGLPALWGTPNVMAHIRRCQRHRRHCPPPTRVLLHSQCWYGALPRHILGSSCLCPVQGECIFATIVASGD
ncbi:peptidase S8/S53 domain-containing protein [Mycena olivaceomarginata]|nr:peptidase S8/S53 domain-containing protein [Mycena olivaceomarginata]